MFESKTIDNAAFTALERAYSSKNHAERQARKRGKALLKELIRDYGVIGVEMTLGHIGAIDYEKLNEIVGEMRNGIS